MAKIIFALLVISLALLVGCASILEKPTSSEIYTPAETNISQSEVSGIEGMLSDKVWISPAEVQVGNFHSGARAEWNIRVHNGKSKLTQFEITYRIPDNTREGYLMPPKEAQDWVIIADNSPILLPNETREILVVLAMPKDVDETITGKKWEFWISVVEGGQGLVQTEMGERWLISMR